MDDYILSPIATIDLEDYNESFNNFYIDYDKSDQLNGNIPGECELKDSGHYSTQSLQSSLENLVNNFDSVISECFNSEEKIDSFSPISEKYKSCNTLIDKNQLWLSLTGSVTMALNLDWHSFKAFEEFTHAINASRHEDFINQNLDLPDDEELVNAMDHHSLVTSSIPSDYEPLKTADEIIEEIDKIMGISFNDELDSGDMTSDFDRSDFLCSDEAIHFGRCALSHPKDLINDIQGMSLKELNDIQDEFEDSIRMFSSLLVDELAERDDLEYEKEQRDLFVKLIHQIEQRQRGKQDEVKSKKLSEILSTESSLPKRSNSWRSIFSRSPTNNGKVAILDDNNRISKSSDNLDKSLVISIPIHSQTRMDKDILVMFNQMLQAMITNPPQFNQLLTDYILNVYAPADDVSLDMSLDDL